MNFVLTEHALVEADLEQEGQRLAHDGPGGTSSWAITCVPSSSGRMAANSSFAASSAMRASRSSIRRDSCIALRSLRVVQSQRVSTFSS